MNHYIKHRGYYGVIYYSTEDESFVGKVLGFRGSIACHAQSAHETEKELIYAIDDYLETCVEEGWIPNSTDPNVAREMETHFRNSLDTSIPDIQKDKKLAIAI